MESDANISGINDLFPKELLDLIFGYLPFRLHLPLCNYQMSERQIQVLLSDRVEAELLRILGEDVYRNLHSMLVQSHGIISGSFMFDLITGETEKKYLTLPHPIDGQQSSYMKRWDIDIFIADFNESTWSIYNNSLSKHLCYIQQKACYGGNGFLTHEFVTIKLFVEDSPVLQINQINTNETIVDWLQKNADFDISKISYQPSNKTRPISATREQIVDILNKKPAMFNFTDRFLHSVNRCLKYQDRGVKFTFPSGEQLFLKMYEKKMIIIKTRWEMLRNGYFPWSWDVNKILTYDDGHNTIQNLQKLVGLDRIYILEDLPLSLRTKIIAMQKKLLK